MSVYINRALNFKRIKAIGFDMDYTLVRYNAEAFEKFAFVATLQKLIQVKGYPESIRNLPFEHQKVIQGLVIDRRNGNLLKLSRFGKVKQAFHGHSPIPFADQQEIYQQRVIDLNDDHIQSLDTNFSISNGVLFLSLTELKKKGETLPHFDQMAEDIKEMIDLAHRDGTLKNEVRKNLNTYIVQDKGTVELLERLKLYKKKLLLITNSDFEYTKLLMEHAINPFLKNHKTWQELFDISITFSMKPRFFTDKSYFLKIDDQTGKMSNHNGPVTNGIFQGGNALKLQRDLGLEGDEILYIGDHIYGDVVSIKKTFNWRTALVLEQLAEELDGLKKGAEIQNKLDYLMDLKSEKEDELNILYAKEKENHEKIDKEVREALTQEIDNLNQRISTLIVNYQQCFNSYWGELMRAGQEESRFAGQVQKYACLYMVKLSDLLDYSPRTYFRPARRILPHEIGYLT